MKLQKGNIAKVIGSTFCSLFRRGEKVQIMKVNKRTYIAKNNKGSWWVRDEDVIKINSQAF